jgi:hypothetical protein
MPNATAMKVTTVRFGGDLWALLADEAARVGVSVSQYVREAALARAAAAAAMRGQAPFDVWAEASTEPRAEADARLEPAGRGRARAGVAREEAAERRLDAHAVRGQSHQAWQAGASKRSKSEDLRSRSEDLVRQARERSKR